MFDVTSTVDAAAVLDDDSLQIIDSAFSRQFCYTKNHLTESWAVPITEEQEVSTVEDVWWRDTELEVMKDSLNDVKSRLSEFDINVWQVSIYGSFFIGFYINYKFL